MTNISGSLIASCFSMCLLAGSAFASGFAIYETSARGFAMANANVGKNQDASALYSNPAAITSLEGVNTIVGSAFISPSVSLNVGASPELTAAGMQEGHVDMDSYTQPIPYFYTTHRLSQRWACGLGVFIPYGLKSKFNEDWQGKYNNVETEITTVNINPNIAYTLIADKPLIKRLSIAVGLQAMYATVDIKRKITGNHMLELKGSNMAYGYNVALQWELNDFLAIGLQYRSHVEQKFDKADAYSPALVASADGRVHATGSIDLPQSLALGFNITPTKRLEIGFQALWTGWSSYDSLDIYIDHPGFGWVIAPKHWDDVWRYSVGAEYMLTEKLALRAGFTYDQDPVNVEYADFMVPSNDRTICSIGLGYQFSESGSINIAYGYTRIKPQNIRKNLAKSVFSDTRINTGHANIIVADLRWRF